MERGVSATNPQILRRSRPWLNEAGSQQICASLSGAGPERTGTRCLHRSVPSPEWRPAGAAIAPTSGTSAQRTTKPVSLHATDSTSLTSSTRASAGPWSSHSRSCATATAGPLTCTETRPSGRFAAKPSRPSCSARRRVAARNPTCWTRPLTRKRRLSAVEFELDTGRHLRSALDCQSVLDGHTMARTNPSEHGHIQH